MTRLKVKCGGCIYYEQAYAVKDQNYGVCQRFPPTMPSSGNSPSAWPVVNSSSGCGEYEAFITPKPSIQDMM